jgi:chromate reductase, NAD(P)H dehydrogenase (quinone)
VTTLIGISGSLRRLSFNSSLLRTAATLMPAGATLQIADISNIPLYNADVENDEGIPAPIAVLKDRIASSAGLLLCSPEYNNAMPGVMKNVIDWLSRPSDDIARVFHGRPVAVMGASPGPFGTTLAQNSWWPVLRTLRTQPWFEGRLMVSRAATVFNDQGELIDEKVRGQLRQFVEGFVAFAARNLAEAGDMGGSPRRHR